MPEDFQPEAAGGGRTTLEGVFAYRVRCTGTVTSVRARGFCPPSATNGSDVVMQIINTDRDSLLQVLTTDVAADCNTSAPVGPDYYEGYVNVDNLSISVVSGGYFGVKLLPKFFQPASINETSSQTVVLIEGLTMTSVPEVSLLFSVNLLTTGELQMKWKICPPNNMGILKFCIFLSESEVSDQNDVNEKLIWSLVTVLLLLYAALITTIIVVWKVRKMQARKKRPYHLPNDYAATVPFSNPVTSDVSAL